MAKKKKEVVQVKRKGMPFGPTEINTNPVEVRTPMGRVGRQ
jgi:hypothetical protein